MIENETLLQLDKNPSLSHDLSFATILASEMNNYYIDESINIIENEIIKIIGKSWLDDKKTLMPYQLMALKDFDKSNKIVFSAPTSFGKSFLVLEYIKRNIKNYKKIVYIVHTKSLKDEIYSKLKSHFNDFYKVTDEYSDVQNVEKYILILISDGQNAYEYDLSLDLLVVDEAYNLSKRHSKDRHFCIMKTYHKLLQDAKKVILLGPYIDEIQGECHQEFHLIKTDYSPVTQKIFEGIDLLDITPHEKFLEEIKKNNKTIAYFGSKSKIYEYMQLLTEDYKEEKYTDSFIEWMEDFFPDFWLLPKLMKRGIGLYHSAFPKYLNLYNMDKFNNGNFSALITTSAILEGINTTSKSLIIFDSTAGISDEGINKLTAFQFFNLCGRVGRLGKEIVGYVYNFGETYKEKYNERSLPLYIGNDVLEDEFDKFDNSESCDNSIKIDIQRLLDNIGIDFNNWYEENSFYSSGSKNMLDLLKAYMEYRKILKNDLLTGTLNKVNSNDLNKNKVIIHFYDNFILKVPKFKYTPRSRFYVQSIIPVFLRSTFNGIDFKMKDLFTDSEIRRNVQDLTIAEKNKYILELMNVGYNYLPHAFYNIVYLFNEFVINDSFWSEKEKKTITKYIFDRVLLYVNGDTGKYSKLKRILSNMGVIPPIIEKLLKKVKADKINVENVTKDEVINYLIEFKDDLYYEEYELINLENIGIKLH